MPARDSGPDPAVYGAKLIVRFTRAGQNYEITYLWQSDLDNYARLTGYLYQPGKQTDSPGMEALFISQNDPINSANRPDR